SPASSATTSTSSSGTNRSRAVKRPRSWRSSTPGNEGAERMDQELIEAIKAGDVAKVRGLVEADPELASARGEFGVSAILLAAYYGRTDVVDLLLERGPELDVFEAAAVGRASRLEEILDERPELVNAYAEDGFTPLGFAAFF